jgi:hypothetical protein
MADLQDLSFTDGLKQLLGLDDDAVNNLIEVANLTQLNDLANAVSTGDKRSALAIYYTLTPRKVPESVDNLNVGDVVVYDGKKVRVQIPNGPNDTIGITVTVGGGPKIVKTQRNKLKMVKRKHVSLESLSEEQGVLGMTVMPGLARMQELAGLAPSEDQYPEVQAEIVYDPEHGDHMQCALNAIEALEDALPEIPLKDIKVIRARLSEIMMMMNESAPAPKARRLKE